MKRLLLLSTFWVLTFYSITFALSAASQWSEILGPARGTIPPAASFRVTWRTDLPAALAEARQNRLPLFVTLRCLPCKQCAEFDKEVLDGGSDLDPLLAQFVTVRLTNAAEINWRIFPIEGFQDLDLSWWGWFLSPDAQVYAVFGGKDHISEKTRISKQALITTSMRVLSHHYDPRREGWNIDGPIPDLKGNVGKLTELPGWASWNNKRSAKERQGCVHCHQVNDILRQPAIDAHTFNKIRDVNVWPFPENVGIELDRDDGLRVKTVFTESPAARIGLRPGDKMGAAAGRKLFGQADFRAALHRGPQDAGTLDLIWMRDAELKTGTLQLTNGWRKTVLDWRMSISQGNIGAGPGFFPLAINQGRRQQFKIAADSMAIEPFMGRNTNNPPYAAGIRGRHIITAVNDQSPNISGRGFLVWFRQQFEPADQVTVTLVDEKSQQRRVTYKLRGE